MSKKTKLTCTAIALIWHTAAVIALLTFWPGESYAGVVVFFTFSFLFLLNFFLLIKVCQAIFGYMKESKKEPHIVNVFVFGIMKIFCLIFTLFILFTYIHTIALEGLFLSLGTVVVLPLFFALVWSHNELKKVEES